MPMDSPSVSDSTYVNYEDAGEAILNRPPVGAVDSSQEESGTVGESAAPTEEQVEAVAEEQPVEEAQDDESFLPNEQERDYDQAVYGRYAKRFRMTMEQLEANPGLKQVLKQKIDSDVYIQQLTREQAELRARLEADQARPEEQEDAQQQPQTFATAEEARADYLKRLDSFAETVTDPAFATEFGKEYYKAWGVAEPTKEDMERVAPLVKAYTKFGSNLVNTIAPQLLSHWMNQVFPGFQDSWERSSYQRAWDNVRSSDERFGEMPAYGSPEFTELISQVAEIEPGFEDMVFRDSKGKPLSSYENAVRQYKLAAVIMSGQQNNVSPAEIKQQVRQAVERGKVEQRQADKKQATGKITGAGQSQGKFTPGKTGQGSGLGLIEAYGSRHPKYLDQGD